MQEIDVAVIGGGVVGCAVAWELAQSGRPGIFLFERNPGITQGENQTSRNSGVIHSGIYYDQETRPEKAALCVEGNRLLYEFCSRYQVPALKTGKLIVAETADQAPVLELYLQRAKQNQVPGVERITERRIRELEPNVRAHAALLVPSAGIIDPVALVYRLHVLGLEQGVMCLTGTEVETIQAAGNGFEIVFQYRDGRRDRVRAGVVINAAGVDADLMARSLNPDSPYELDPIRGDSYKFYSHKREELRIAGQNIYPTPKQVVTPHRTHFTVGIHLTPTFADMAYPPSLGSTVTIGPKLVAVKDRNAWAGNWADPAPFVEGVRPFFPGIQAEDLIWHQAGLQARLRGMADFVIRPDLKHPHCIHLLGIDSPGLSAAPAIARRVKSLLGMPA